MIGYSLHVKYPLFLWYCNEIWIYSTGFPKKKNCQISNFMKIRPVEANSRFTHFCERALKFLFSPMPPPHVLVDFVVLPPGHVRSVTDFWGWDAHEAQLCCPDDVWVVI